MPTTCNWVVPDEAVDSPAFRWKALQWSPGREARLIVEIGSGVGEATAVLAALASGVRHRRLWRCGDPAWRTPWGCWPRQWSGNVRLLSVDAVWSLEHLFGPGEVEELCTFFPDTLAQEAAPQAAPGHARVRRTRGCATPTGRGVAAGH